ncbi:MAG: ABC transporter permease [Halobaculum sp.]
MGITWYVARRLGWTLFAAWFAMTVTFVIIEASPSADQLQAAVRAAQSAQGDPSEAVKDYKIAQGATGTPLERYKDYMVGILTLNWGWSTERQQFALTAIAKAWPYSFQYALPTVILTTIFGYGLGLLAAVNQGDTEDAFATVVAFFGASIPNFWFAIMGILVMGVWAQDAVLFGVSLKPISLPVFYDSGIPKKYGFVSWQNAKQLIMPVFVLATGGLGLQMRYSRAQAIENFQKEFVRTARAKGHSDLGVMFKHVLRVALVPLTNILVGTVLGVLVGSAVVIETIFQIPGLGLLFLQAATQQDIPLILGPALIFSAITIFGNLIEDLLYTVLDPRVDFDDR